MTKAKVGDRAKFIFSPSNAIVGTIEYIPQTTGDYWIIKEDDGSIVYIQQFQLMYLRY